MFRHCTFSREELNEEDRTAKMSFSSEEPYERWFGTEILDHDKKSVLLKRLNTGGALLVDHDTRDQVGVIEKAFIADRKGSAVVRFGKSGRAEEVFQDVRDGIRQNVSVGYRIHKMKQEDSDPENPIFRATRWEPLEVSIVSVPADISVGIGREDDQRKYNTEVIKKELIMPEEPVKTDKKDTVPDQPVVDLAAVNQAREEAREKEMDRVREILALGEQFDMAEDARKAVSEGRAVEDFKTDILEKVGNVQPVQTDPDLGLNRKEKQNYSIVRLINHLIDRNDAVAREAASFEIECSQAFEKKTHRTARGAFVPPDVLSRDLNVTTDGEGGYLVGTNLLAAQMIEMLRNKMMVEVAGATILDDLVGDIAIPKQSGAATAYWVAEAGAPTESQQTLAQLQLAPKTVAAYTDYTRKLMLQSSITVENFVRNDLTRVLALAIDLAALHGTGSSNQPTGIAATNGIGSVAGGTNGLAPAWSHMVNLETEVAQDNADVGRLAYMTNAKVRGKLKQVFTNATYGEIPLWQTGSAPGIGELNGYPAYVTNQVSSALTKGSSSGVCSAIFFGNWADLIVGTWSGIDLLVDPYSLSTSAGVRVTAFKDVDVGVRHAQSFAAMLDALTT